MNIYNYIENYGKYTFDDKKFNDVDAAIFSFLSYANLKYIINSKKIKISDAGSISKRLYAKGDNNIVAVKEGNELLCKLKDSIRYKNCILSKFKITEKSDIQFSAVAIQYTKRDIFISYEGTNELFSGWMENFLLSYKFPTKSQKMAIRYLNKNFTFTNKNIIVGGHSKGGNLALVAAMYANKIVRRKIKKIYSIDGPGLLDRQFNSRRFKAIKKNYLHIIPDYSLVGLFFNNTNNIVVKSRVKNIYSHSIMFWEINSNYTFTRTELSIYSKELKNNIDNWLSKYTVKDKKEFVNNLFYILEKANVNSILDLKENINNIISLIKESTNLDKNTKHILQEFILIVIKCYEDSSLEEIKEKFVGLFS